MGTLTDKQVENWRRILLIQGWGAFALICPKETVIAYVQRIKQILECAPKVRQARQQEIKPVVKKCPPHKNTITGNRGTYCCDCETYI